MKKVLFFAIALIAFCGAAQAQEYKPTKGTFTTELDFTPFNSNTGESFSLPDMGIKGRYFFTDNLAIRASLGFGWNSTKEHEFSGNPEVEQTTTNSSVSFSLMPGVEYHFGNWEKMSLYCGAEFGFGIISRSSSVKNLNFTADEGKISGPNTTGITFDIFTGFDYYFTKNLFVGAELGLGFNSAWDGETTITQTGQPETKDKDYSSATSFGFYCNPAIRLGWKF